MPDVSEELRSLKTSVTTFLPVDTASHPRILESSTTPMWQPQTPNPQECGVTELLGTTPSDGPVVTWAWAENLQGKTEVLLESCLSATVSITSHVRITLGLNPRLRYVWLGQWNCFSNRYVVVNDSVLCKYKPQQAVTVRLGWDATSVYVQTDGFCVGHIADWMQYWHNSKTVIWSCYYDWAANRTATSDNTGTLTAEAHPDRCHYCRM